MLHRHTANFQFVATCVQYVQTCLRYVVEDVQVFDINAPAPEAFGRDYHLVLASNALHTGDNIAGKGLRSSPAFACIIVSSNRGPPIHKRTCIKQCCKVQRYVDAMASWQINSNTTCSFFFVELVKNNGRIACLV